MAKVLFVSPCDLPIPSTKGGAVSQLIDNFIKENSQLEINIISIYDKNASMQSIEYCNCHFFYVRKTIFITCVDMILNFFLRLFKISSENKNYLWKLKVINKTKHLLRKEKFDSIIFENSGYLLKCINRKIANQYRNKLFYHLHNDIPDSASNEKLRECNLILISKYLLKKIELRKLSYKKAYILKNSIPTYFFNNDVSMTNVEETKKSLGIERNRKVVIFVGRIVEYKGVEILIDAFSMLPIDEYVLLIVGSVNFGQKENSSFYNRIISKTASMNNVIFTGFVPNEELSKYYRIADLAVLPSLWEEPAGLTLLEACCCGIPLISTNRGGIPEYIDENYVQLLDIKDIRNELLNRIKHTFETIDYYKEKAIEYSKIVYSQYNTKRYYNEFRSIIEGDEEN